MIEKLAVDDERLALAWRPDQRGNPAQQRSLGRRQTQARAALTGADERTRDQGDHVPARSLAYPAGQLAHLPSQERLLLAQVSVAKLGKQAGRVGRSGRQSLAGHAQWRQRRKGVCRHVMGSVADRDPEGGGREARVMAGLVVSALVR